MAAAAVPLAIAAVGAIAGGIKHHQETVKYNQDKELAAQMQQWSPWTGQHGTMPTNPGGSFGDVFSGASSGAALGMGLNNMGGSGSVTPVQQQEFTPATSQASYWQQAPTLYSGAKSPWQQ